MAKKENFKEIFTLYQEKKASLKDLEKEIKLLENRLKEIPENSSQDGIYRRTWENQSISYSKVIEEARELIPKTKLSSLDKIIENHTRSYPINKFKEV